ncbi:hypothetical protein F5Y17DRAFT_411025 [Xylariaceae sp. FL0594]|nr:hypothetical protein F5Y17DRAFT_411025 [Xylariaceae sp. FL0594]
MAVLFLLFRWVCLHNGMCVLTLAFLNIIVLEYITRLTVCLSVCVCLVCLSVM